MCSAQRARDGRVWEEMSGSTYIAQAVDAPSERHIREADAPVALKVDIRNYVYAGGVKLVPARL